jgi:hypothetical protein
MSKTAIIPGSLGAIAAQSGATLAQSFMQADAIVIVDTSSSMGEPDADGPARPAYTASWDKGFQPRPQTGRTRYQAACDELAKLQASLPGRIAVVSFSTTVQFCPGGVPTNLQGGTNMAEALAFVRPADGCGMTFFLISDGEPHDPDRTLAEARKFSDPITTIFVGSGPGAAFLARLAALTGGTSTTKQIPQLAAHIGGLLAEKAA